MHARVRLDDRAAAGGEGGRVIVLACGGLKQSSPAPALELYRGPLFTSARAWALSVAPRDRIWILSALHGLIPADQVIAPYDARARDAEALAELLRPELLELLGPKVYFVGGSEYFEALAARVPVVVSLSRALPPGRATRGIGAQRSWLARNLGRLPELRP